MGTLLECRFLRTALSGDSVIDQTALMADFDEFYIAATNLLVGDWQTAGREYTKALFLLKASRNGEKIEESAA